MVLRASCLVLPLGASMCACREDGSGVVVRDLAFKGNRSVPTSQLTRILATQKTGGILPWPKRYFTREQFEADLRRIEAFYIDRGYPTARVAGFVAEPPTGSLERALDLDYFEIRASGENGAGPSVSIGEQVGASLYVKVRQEFGPSEVTQLTLEYRLASFLRLVASVAEGSQTRSNYVEVRRTENQSVDLVFVWRY